MELKNPTPNGIRTLERRSHGLAHQPFSLPLYGTVWDHPLNERCALRTFLVRAKFAAPSIFVFIETMVTHFYADGYSNTTPSQIQSDLLFGMLVTAAKNSSVWIRFVRCQFRKWIQMDFVSYFVGRAAQLKLAACSYNSFKRNSRERRLWVKSLWRIGVLIHCLQSSVTRDLWLNLIAS